MTLDPFDQLKLIRQARIDNREELQAISAANIGIAAAAVLTFNEMNAANMLFGADFNAPIDVPVPASLLGALGSGVSEVLDAARPTQPETEFQS